MSDLQSRIHTQQYAAGAGLHPATTPGTPLVMPASEISYSGDTVLYGTLHPLVSADGAVIAGRPAPWPSPYVPGVVPAGRP